MYLSAKTISAALDQLQGTASHLLKIWLVLKHMGLSRDTSILIDTQNSTPTLQRLFSCGSPEGKLFVPFAHTQCDRCVAKMARPSLLATANYCAVTVPLGCPGMALTRRGRERAAS